MKKQPGKIRQIIAVLVLFAAALPNIVSCNDTFTALIPNNEQKIIQFNVKNIERRVCSTRCEINGHSVTVTVPAGTDVTKLLPDAVVSYQATVFPITLRYLQEAFPATDVLQLIGYANNPQNIGALDRWFFSLYADNPGFGIPPLVFPVNFLSPVTFAVIGGQGSFELYTVKVMYDDGTDPATGILPPGIPAEKNILTFTVPGQQIGTSVISEHTIDFQVQAEAEIRNLLPVITASDGAVVLPVTQEYIKRFCEENGLDYLNVLSGFITAPDKKGYLTALVAPLDISRIRVPIDLPIDCTNPVFFAVLGKDKDVKLYTATCKKESDKAYLEDFVITKFKNPAIVTDGTIEINKETKTINATLLYPVEYAQNGQDAFSLFCDAVFIGDSAEIDYKGISYTLSEKIPFAPENPAGQYALGSTQAVVHIHNAGGKTSYTLTLHFKEDPDTIRSITDFRFEKFYNDGIKNTAMAAISHNGHEGTINVTVLYSTPEKPERLIPSFISAGKVTVNGVEQHSAVDGLDFRTAKVYLCTSQNGQYTRRYTVKVTFIKIETAQPVLKSFTFPNNLNSALSADAVGRIDEAANAVYVNIQYSSPEVPDVLIPEFSATGTVTVNGLPQSSGFSSQNFTYTVYYTVSDPSDPAVRKIYGVHVAFTFAQDAGCELLSFTLLAADNPSLTEDIAVPISTHSNDLYAVLPQRADITNLVPSFTAKGRVFINSVEQTAGVSAVDFSAPVEYTVISENGAYTKRYRVKLQKTGNIIYVNAAAAGRNNGSTWEDAFIRLDRALEKAETLPPDTIPEIWIMKDFTAEQHTYKINRQISVRGGFSGVELSKDQRNKDNKTVLSDVIFSSDSEISGTLILDSLTFKGNNQPLQAVTWAAGHDTALELKNCGFFQNSSVEAERTLALLTITDTVFGTGGMLSTKADFSGKIILSNSQFYSADLHTSGRITAENCSFHGDSITAHAEHIAVTHAELHNACTLAAEKKLTLKELKSPYYQVTLAAAAENTVIMERCNIKELIFKNSTAAVTKLNTVTLKDSFIGTLTADPTVITARLTCRGTLAGLHTTGTTLTLPSCQTEITDAVFNGAIETVCAMDVFGSVCAAVSLNTQIRNITAAALQCGFIKDKQPAVVQSNLAFGRHNDKQNKVPPNHDYYQHCTFFSAYKEAEADGMQTITGSTFKECRIFSGSEITFSDNRIIADKDKENHYALNGAWWKYILLSNNNVSGRFDTVFLKNAATPNSRIAVHGVTATAGWFRAETHTLKVGGADSTTGISGFSRAEFYGLNSVDVRKSDFKDIIPVLWEYRYEHYNVDKEVTRITRESFIAAGNEVTVTDNDFQSRCPILIGAVHNLDIAHNRFSGYMPEKVKKSGKNIGHYFELTLLYRKDISFSNAAFASLLITPNYKTLNDILNLSGTTADNTVTLQNCYFESGLSILNQSVIIDGCSFGFNRPRVNCGNYEHIITLLGGSGTHVTIQNLDINGIRFYGTWHNLILYNSLYRSSFINGHADRATIKDCIFKNFQQSAIDLSGSEIEFTRNNFIYDNSYGIDIRPSILELYSKKLACTSCRFEGRVRLKKVLNSNEHTATSYAHIAGTTTKIEDTAFLLDIDRTINPNAHCVGIPVHKGSIASIKNCEFKNAIVEIKLDSHRGTGSEPFATVDNCRFFERSTLYIENNGYKNPIEEPARAALKNCTLEYVKESPLKVYNSGSGFSSCKIAVEQCMFKPKQGVIPPYHFAAIEGLAGPTLLMAQYTNTQEAAQYKNLLNNTVHLSNPNRQAVFMNLPDGISPASSAAAPYKIKGTVAPLQP